MTRRDEILAVAAKMFSARGYGGVAIDEVGEAAGVTGPAIYHHFPNKGALLVAIFHRVLDRLERDIDEVLRCGERTLADLERALRIGVSFAIDERALAVVYVREVATLPDEQREPIMRRQRRAVAAGAGFLRDIKPDLTPEQARTRWIAVMQGLIASVGLFRSRLDRKDLEEELVAMAKAALLA